MKKYQTPLWGFLFVFIAVMAQAQTALDSRPYLVSAIMNIAVDAQADIWLNGIYIAHCPRTTLATGYQTIVARPDSLCYFKDRNTLAIRLESYQGKTPNAFIGVSYVFKFKLSDGTVYQINSSSILDHRCLYLPSLGSSEPAQWYNKDFDDSMWSIAQSSGNKIPEIAFFSGSRFGGTIPFLTAGTDGYVVQHPGEKQLFRRYFNLNIGINPRCQPPSTLAAPKNLWPNPPPAPLKPIGAETPKLSMTPITLQSHPEALAAPPQLIRPHRPKSHRRVRRRRKPRPVATPIINLPPVSLPDFIADAPERSPVAPATLVSLPTATPTMVIQDDGSLVFGQSDANILVTFGDGPGVYKVEVVNENFGHLKTLLNQEIVSDSEMWLTWDGKDDSGMAVPEGQYYILCSKGGVILQKILLRRVP